MLVCVCFRSCSIIKRWCWIFIGAYFMARPQKHRLEGLHSLQVASHPQTKDWFYKVSNSSGRMIPMSISILIIQMCVLLLCLKQSGSCAQGILLFKEQHSYRWMSNVITVLCSFKRPKDRTQSRFSQPVWNKAQSWTLFPLESFFHPAKFISQFCYSGVSRYLLQWLYLHMETFKITESIISRQAPV